MKIEDYGFIGDLQTAALVGKDGSIDWLCLPRFDSPAVFAKLLGNEQNGSWQICPQDKSASSRQQYRPDTLVLETIFENDSASARVVDCMNHRGEHRSVIRVVEGIKGRMAMRMLLRIRLDYGAIVPWVKHSDGGIAALAGPDALILRSEVETHGADTMATGAEFEIKEGESVAFVLTYFPSHLSAPEEIDPRRVLVGVEGFWREWASRYKYDGEYRDAVVRSLITLKGLTFNPTGGLVAAATTSLPERIGGIRNWDYRYCWLRDATLTLFSFMQSGYTEEAGAWIQWLLRASAGSASQLQTLYGAAGERLLPESELPHLSGYEGSKPVRIGNAAAEQFQLDVYGELMDALHLARTLHVPATEEAWPLQKHFVKFVQENWDKPDEGIWEIRGPRRHFTHSKVMAWVAIDRAVKAVETFDLPGELEEWKTLREKIHADICEKAYDKKRGVFTQYYGSSALDANCLIIPLVGFLPASDERVERTIDAIDRELSVDGLIMRYSPEESAHVDGLPPGEGIFLPCSFWMVDCLKMLGREKEANKRLKNLMKLCSPLGLLSEEYDPKRKRLVGNFPQAFTHVGLVNSVHNLSDEVEGPAMVRCRDCERKKQGA
jgi:GH15 family glucan-1,4-alpha-glucosidase